MTDMKAVGERGQKEHLCSHVRTQLGFLLKKKKILFFALIFIRDNVEEGQEM